MQGKGGLGSGGGVKTRNRRPCSSLVLAWAELCFAVARHGVGALVDVEQAVRVGGGAVWLARGVIQRRGPDVVRDEVGGANIEAERLANGAEAARVRNTQHTSAAVLVHEAERCSDSVPACDGVVCDRTVEAAVGEEAAIKNVGNHVRAGTSHDSNPVRTSRHLDVQLCPPVAATLEAQALKVVHTSSQCHVVDLHVAPDVSR